MVPDLPVGQFFGRPVIDADGRTIGNVHDARLRRDGPGCRARAGRFGRMGALAGASEARPRRGYRRGNRG